MPSLGLTASASQPWQGEPSPRSSGPEGRVFNPGAAWNHLGAGKLSRFDTESSSGINGIL